MSTPELRVTVVQRAAALDPDVNRAALADLAALEADLVVLPEAAARDFGEPGSDLAPYAEALDGPFVRRLTEVAGGTVVAGMFEVAPDRDRPWNTVVAVDRGGLRASYRKIHLYDSFGFKESDQLSPGDPAPCVLDVVGWRVGLMTCYDLRFPELGRALVDAGAEVLLVPAAWVAGEHKVDHWLTLLRARAIENTVWVVGAAQPGPRYCGHSAVVAPDGDILAVAEERPATLGVTLDRERLEQVRRTNPSLANRRL
ncbi:MAG: carbon-nitrogen hydrolase family protein [Marmoricola sp.]